MKHPILKFFLFVLLIFAIVCAVFWQEISEATGGFMEDQAVFEKLPGNDLQAIIGARLDRERNDIRKISVRNLQVGERSGQDVEMSFLLTNKGGINDYPALRVHLLDRQHKVIRYLEVSAEDYNHADFFTAERIKLNVTLRTGEASFTVEPFYKTEGDE